MLKTVVYILGEVAVFECSGRIVAGAESTALSSAVLSRGEIRHAVLDLAGVERIDAHGLGVLLDLRARCRARGIQLQLMNVPRRVGQLLEVTHLHRVFGVSRARDISLPMARPPESALAGPSP